jgi:hypothetical protein
MPSPSTDTFFAKCLPALRTDFQSCARLSDCDLSPTTEGELDSIYTDSEGRFRIMGAILETNFMGKACQIRENPLYDFVMKYAKEWGTKKLNIRKNGFGGNDVEPFVIVGRRAIINNNYWKFAAGVSGAGTAPNGAAYTLRIDATSLGDVPISVDWFPLGQSVFISGRGSTGGATLTQWKIAYADNANNVIRLYLVSQTSGAKTPSYKNEVPLEGVGMRGLANVSPYEKYCYQIPRLNDKIKYPAFIQNTRWTLCHDELTQRFIDRLREGNPLYSEYYAVDEAEYNRQVIQDFQYRLVNTFLFNTALPNQTMAAWDQLEEISSWSDSGIGGSGIYLPDIEGRCVGRRANAEGVYQQLAECGRVKDLLGQRMNFPELQAELYNMMRVRSDNGTPQANIFDIVVDSAFRPLFIQALVRYQQAKYEGAARYNIEVKDVRTNAGFVFSEFIMDYPAGMVLRVVSHYALDDLLTAHVAVNANLASPGRKALLLDWSTIYFAIIESRTVTRRTGDAEEIAKFNEDALCVIDIPKRSMKLNTMAFSTIVDCPRANLWIENFSFEVPEHQIAVGDSTDIYGNYTGNDAATP